MSGGSEYKEVFLNESREYLSTLNNALVTLEKDPAQGEAIREIFRAAHTLKGMSATMGYEPMARLTHQMETVLEPVRSGAQPLSPFLVDALFQCLDQLEKWVGVLATEDSLEESDLQATLESLQRASRKLEDASGTVPPPVAEESWTLSEPEKEVLSQAAINGFSIFKVMVELDPLCAFKEVRAFMLLRNINDLGEVVKAHPSPEDIEKGRFSKGFTLLVVTEKDPQTIQKSLLGVGEVSQVTVTPFQAEGSPKSGAPSSEKKTPAPKVPMEAAAEERSFILPTVRVHTSKLDKLMELVQELAISKIRFEIVKRISSFCCKYLMLLPGTFRRSA